MQAETLAGSVHYPYVVNPSLGHGQLPADATAADSMFHPYPENQSNASGSEPSDVTATGSVLHPYLVELIRTTVKDEVEEVEERLHRDVTSMHVDMLIRIDQLQVCSILQLISYSVKTHLYSAIMQSVTNESKVHNDRC